MGNKTPNQTGLVQNQRIRKEIKAEKRKKEREKVRDKKREKLEEFRKDPEKAVDEYVHNLMIGENNANERISKVLLKWLEIKLKSTETSFLDIDE